MALSGQVVANRYTIVREIGRGGMATVWLAEDRQHARQVAIKTLHPELAGAVGTDRFLREIRLTAQLQHPGIVPILDSGALALADGTTIPWYAMPFLEGESLRVRLTREQQLPIDDALRITNAVGLALEAAHRVDIVHRDIKPENVFLTAEHVYVVDFGVARAVATTDAERLTSTGLAIGTPAYMSPEQAVAGTVDARSDQYSLGAILYEMLAGEPPFSGPNPQVTIARRLTESARPLSTVRSTIPPPVERATLRTLERTPADRFPSVSAFLAALREPTDRPAAGVRPGRWKFAAIAAAALVVAASAWGLMSGRQTVDPEVLALYERGMRAYDTRTSTGVAEAITTFHALILRDSTYAPAWNALAKSYVRAHQRGFQIPEIPQDRFVRLARVAVDRSLELDSLNADTWTTRAMVSQQVEPTDITPALRAIRRSIGLDSSQALTWVVFGTMTAETGDLSGALEAWRHAARLDPAYPQALAFMALGHYWRGDYDSAAVWSDSGGRVDENYLLGRQSASAIAVERGRFDEAKAHAEAAVRLSEEVEYANSLAQLATVLARAGSKNLAMAQLLVAEVSAGPYQPTPPHTALWLAEANAALGNIPKALRALGQYRYPNDMHFQLHLRCAPTFAPLERDSAFRALLRIPRPAPGIHC